MVLVLDCKKSYKPCPGNTHHFIFTNACSNLLSFAISSLSALRFDRNNKKEKQEKTKAKGHFIVQDFLPVLVICSFDKDPIRNKYVMCQDMFGRSTRCFRLSRTCDSEVDHLVSNLKI